MRADAQAKRQALLRAAWDLMAERGPDVPPLRTVAQRADVGIGTLYRHFPTREALVLGGLLDDFGGRVTAIIEDHLERWDENPEAVWRGFVTSLAELGFGEIAFQIGPLATSSTLLVKNTQERRDRMITTLERILDAARRQGCCARTCARSSSWSPSRRCRGRCRRRSRSWCRTIVPGWSRSTCEGCERRGELHCWPTTERREQDSNPRCRVNAQWFPRPPHSAGLSTLLVASLLITSISGALVRVRAGMGDHDLTTLPSRACLGRAWWTRDLPGVTAQRAIRQRMPLLARALDRAAGETKHPGGA